MTGPTAGAPAEPVELGLPARLLRAYGLAPYFRGKSRLERIVEPLVKFPSRLTPIRFPNGLVVELDGRSLDERFIYYHDCDPDVAAFVNAAIEPGKTFLDCGAHIGYFSLLAAKRTGSAGHVYAFEPSPATYTRLTRNIGANGLDNISAFPLALGEGLHRTHLHRLDQWNHGMDSLMPTPESVDLGEVEVWTLDYLVSTGRISRPDVMKLDAEGAELSILKGAEQVLRSDSPAMIIELSRWTQRRFGYEPEDVIAYLQGIRPYRIDWAFLGRRPLKPGVELPHYRRLGSMHGSNYIFWPDNR